jgi:hypothetical protein
VGPIQAPPSRSPPYRSLLKSEFHSSFLYHLVFLRSMRRLLVTASIVPSSPILVTLIMEASSSETSVLTRATGRNIPENTILHSHLHENLKSYIIIDFAADIFLCTSICYIISLFHSCFNYHNNIMWKIQIIKTRYFLCFLLQSFS